MKKQAWMFAGVVGLGLAGCATDDAAGSPAGDGGTATAASAACSYDFSATVRSGPAAGTEVAGALYISRTTDDAFMGSLRPRDGSAPLTVGGHLAAGQMTLQIQLADGRTMTGSGAYAGAFEACQMNLAGELTGPSAGDTGDWLSQRILCNARCNTCIDNACGETCSRPNANSIVAGGMCVGLVCPTHCFVCQVNGYGGACAGACNCN